MKHPSSAKVFEWVGLLEKAAGIIKNTNIGVPQCDMEQVQVWPECGTPGCHGGWASIALSVDYGDYVDGACELAEFLGFQDQFALDDDGDEFDVTSVEDMCDWAERNHCIWGNRAGGIMFSSRHAFGQSTNIFPVQVLIDHWRGVGERLKAIEEAGT